MPIDFHPVMEAIENGNSFGLIGHQNPDGDALGSALAMALLLSEQGKQCWVSWPEPFEESRAYYDFLPGTQFVVAPTQTAECEVAMAFDCASLRRLGELGDVFEKANESIVLDHHLSNEGYGKRNVIDAAAPSTTALVYKLATELGWPLNEAVATCLYTGLICDTGRFQYGNTDARTFGMAQELVNFGVPIASLSRRIFEQDRFAVLQLTAYVIGKSELDPDLRFIWSSITSADLDKFGVKRVELDGVIDALRRAEEADVACFLRDYDGEVHGSLRSIERTDVSAIAKSFGGGGHKLAAGFSTSLSIPETVARIKEQLK